METFTGICIVSAPDTQVTTRRTAPGTVKRDDVEDAEWAARGVDTMVKIIVWTAIDPTFLDSKDLDALSGTLRELDQEWKVPESPM